MDGQQSDGPGRRKNAEERDADGNDHRRASQHRQKMNLLEKASNTAVERAGRTSSRTGTSASSRRRR